MSDQQPKRRGRPPRDSAGGPGVYHLGLRFNAAREEQIKRALAAAIERARKAGVPANITASGLVTMWICERLDEEVGPVGKKR